MNTVLLHAMTCMNLKNLMSRKNERREHSMIPLVYLQKQTLVTKSRSVVT